MDKNSYFRKINLFSLYKKIINNIGKNNSFVIFKKPYDNKIFAYFNSNCKSFNKTYFIIKNFNLNCTIKIKPKIIYYIEFNKNILLKYKNNIVFNLPYNYIDLIKIAIDSIKRKFFKKVVLSKKITIPFKNISLTNTFKKLIYSYPNSMVNIWYHIKHGFWIGSTPELLIKCRKKKLYIMSLASTIWGSNKWTKKEFDEHNIVTQYIINTLKKYCSGYLSVSKTKILHIGNIKHLKTNIIFTFFKIPNYYYILKKLYPTPSICGYPIIESINFIKKNEGYNRCFYTGYIGIINKHNNMELYINLRCANILNYKIILYAGSGITINSNAYKEYLETYNKIKNLFSKLDIK